MYATLKTIPAWNNILVTPIYIINAISMGALCLYCFTRFCETAISSLYELTLFSLISCLLFKVFYWFYISTKIISTAETANGPGKNG